MKKRPSGMTLVEIMVVLTIIGVLLAVAISRLNQSGPDQALRTAQQKIYLALQKAQGEAQRTSKWTCVKFSSKKTEIYIDNDGNHGAASSCGNSGDPLALDISTFPIALGQTGAIAFPSCSNANILSSCAIWVSSTGTPKLCANSSCFASLPSCPSGTTSGDTCCIDWDYQIVLSHPLLGSQTKAREIEFTRSGILELPKIGEKGLLTSLWALNPAFPSGTGSCE